MSDFYKQDDTNNSILVIVMKIFAFRQESLNNDFQLNSIKASIWVVKARLERHWLYFQIFGENLAPKQ